MFVTCRTEDCPSNGNTIEIQPYLDPETGETRYADLIVCGACGQPITDTQEAAR